MLTNYEGLRAGQGGSVRGEIVDDGFIYLSLETRFV
jgi:hypothetical protein